MKMTVPKMKDNPVTTKAIPAIIPGYTERGWAFNIPYRARYMGDARLSGILFLMILTEGASCGWQLKIGARPISHEETVVKRRRAQK